MRRSDLEAGGLYAGPNGECYEIVDLTSGWRVESGKWVEDHAVRSRYMPGRGSVPYRTNLAIRVWRHEEGDDGRVHRHHAVIDPRQLVAPWEEYLEEQEKSAQLRKQAEFVIKAARRALRQQPEFRPSAASAYRPSADGSSITIPTEDLAVLAGFHGVHTATEPKGSTKVDWRSP